MDLFVTSNSVALSSAAQPAPSASTSAGSAEQSLPSSALHFSNSAEQPVPDESGDEHPKKKCKHDHVVVCLKNLIIPEILQPIQTVLAHVIDTFKIECEQWDPPCFGDDVTEDDKPKFLLRNVYARWCSNTGQQHPPSQAYAVIKGLLALLHSDVGSVVWKASQNKRYAANKLYRDLFSNQVRTISFYVRNCDLLALAMREHMIAGKVDNRQATIYLKYIADFAETHFPQQVRATIAS